MGLKIASAWEDVWIWVGWWSWKCVSVFKKTCWGLKTNLVSSTLLGEHPRGVQTFRNGDSDGFSNVLKTVWQMIEQIMNQLQRLEIFSFTIHITEKFRENLCTQGTYLKTNTNLQILWLPGSKIFHSAKYCDQSHTQIASKHILTLH